MAFVLHVVIVPVYGLQCRSQSGRIKWICGNGLVHFAVQPAEGSDVYPHTADMLNDRWP